MKKILRELKEYAALIIFCLVIQNFVVTHASVPTGSMIPTINIGDHLVVNRIPSYYRAPKHGEVVTFKHDGEILIKRVMAIGGDEINLLDGHVYINGKKIDESNYLDASVLTYAFSNGIQFPYTIPEEYYFMMGDNRGDSKDSRYFGAIDGKDIRTIGALKIYPFTDIDILK